MPKTSPKYKTRADLFKKVAQHMATSKYSWQGNWDESVDLDQLPRFVAVQHYGANSTPWFDFAKTLQAASQKHRAAIYDAEDPSRPGVVIDLDTGDTYETVVKVSLKKLDSGDAES